MKLKYKREVLREEEPPEETSLRTYRLAARRKSLVK